MAGVCANTCPSRPVATTADRLLNGVNSRWFLSVCICTVSYVAYRVVDGARYGYVIWSEIQAVAAASARLNTGLVLRATYLSVRAA